MLERYVVGTGARLFHVGACVHGLDDDVVMARLRQDLDEECGPGWWAVLLFGDGRGIMRGQHSRVMAPDEERRERALQLAVALNRKLDVGGHWVTGWTAGGMLKILFRDGDGDLQFTVDGAESWERMRHWPVDSHLVTCANAMAVWTETIRHKLELAPSQQIRAALGERPAH
jgi:hypothetical protein